MDVALQEHSEDSLQTLDVDVEELSIKLKKMTLDHTCAEDSLQTFNVDVEGLYIKLKKMTLDHTCAQTEEDDFRPHLCSCQLYTSPFHSACRLGYKCAPATHG